MVDFEKIYDMEKEKRYYEDPISVIKEELKIAGKEEYSKPAVIEYLTRTAYSYMQLQYALKMIKFCTIGNGEISFMDKRAERRNICNSMDYQEDGSYVYPAMYVNEYGVVIDIAWVFEKERENDITPFCRYEGYPRGSIYLGGILLNVSGCEKFLKTFEETYYYYTSRYPELKKWYSDYFGVNEKNVEKYSNHSRENREKLKNLVIDYPQNFAEGQRREMEKA